MSEPVIITSRNNPRLVRVRKVRDGKIADEIFVEGRRVVAEVLRSEVEVVECIMTTEFAAAAFGETIRRQLDTDRTPILQISEQLFKSVSDTVHAQGVALVVKRPQTGRDMLESSVAEGSSLFVCLHESNDPSNVGAVLRAAEAAGVSGVILTSGSADALSPKALRAGMGSNVRVPLWDRADMADVIEWARRRKIRILATDLDSKLSYAAVDWRKPSLVIFGSEAHGLDESLIKVADEVIAIPMKNGVESLNLAVSAGIILFEAVRQTT